MIRPVLGVAVFALCSLVALADEKPKPVPQPGNKLDVKPIGRVQYDPFSLAILQYQLNSEVVRDDLKITDAQAAEIKKAQEELPKKIQELVKEYSEKLKAAEKPEDKTALFGEQGKKIQELQANTFKAILKPEQITRLKQIAIQLQGGYAFTFPEVAEKLKLTDEQKTKQREAVVQMQKDTSEFIKEMTKDGGKFDPEKFAAKMQELQKKAFETITKELTAEQAAAWKELVGPPFDLEKYRKGLVRSSLPAPALPSKPVPEKPVEK